MRQTWKRISVLCLTVIMTVALLPANIFATAAATTGDSKEGGEKNPYKIAVAADLERLREHPNAYFALTENIDMTGVSFLPIAEPFTGTLEGNGKTISNLTLDGANVALFVEIGYQDKNNQGVVTNLVFKNAAVKGTDKAAVVALNNKGIISNVKIDGGTVQAGAEKPTEGIAGAIAAEQTDVTGTIKKCASTAAVKGGVAGGLVGSLEAGTLEACYVDGKVSGGQNAITGAVFGATKAAEFKASDVLYPSSNAPAGMKTAAGGESAQTKAEPYTGKGFVEVTVQMSEGVAQGEEGNAPVAFSTALDGKLKVTYTSSAPKVLAVNKNTGAYKAIAAGDAFYQYTLSSDKFTYNISLPVTKVAAVESGTPDTDSSASSSVPESADNSVSSDTQGDEAATSAPSSAVSSDSSASVSSSDSSQSSSSSSSTASSSSGAASEASSAVSSDSAVASDSSSTSDSVAASSSVDESSASVSGAGSGSLSTSSELPEEEEAENLPEEIKKGSWSKKDGKNYYTLADGTKATGPQVIEDLYYVFDENGAVYRYQFFYDGGWYLANDTGALYRNCFLTGKTSRTFYNLEGAAKTGWIKGPDEKEYYQRVSDTIGVVLATGVFKTDDGQVCLFDKDGARNTGTGWFDGVHLQDGIVSAGKMTVDGKTYVFKEDGTPNTGEFTYGGTAYCADENGVLYLDAFRKMEDGTLRYYDADGQAKTGWIDHNGGRYYQNNSLVILTGRQAVNSTIYFFGSDGKLSTTDGWAGDYYVRGGEALTGMQNLDGKTYYFGTDGMVVRGTFTYQEAKYCGDENGVLHKNAVAYETDGTGAYYSANGQAVPGWVTLGTDKYYQLPTLVLATGKHVIDGEAYFFTIEGKQLTGDGWAGNYYVKGGRVVTGLQTIDGASYVFSDEGSVYKNEFTWKNGAYCADAMGKLYTDTIRTLADGALRYFGKDGKAPTSWVETNGGKYYQAENLTLLTGKQTIGGKTYYFDSMGLMITAGWVGGVYVMDGMPAQGQQTVDGKQYIFSETGVPYKFTFTYNKEQYLASGTGVLYTNCFLTSEGKTTYYGVTGAAPTGWFTLGGGARYYQTKDYSILTGQQKVDNKLYFFGSDGKLATKDGWAGDYYVVGGAALTGKQALDGVDYFFNEEGLVQRGELVIEGANYFANEKGAIQKDYTSMREDGTLRYYGTDGKAVTSGWFKRGEAEYYQSTDMTLAVGKKTIDNQICFFEADGKRKTTDGWAGDYYVKDGVAVTGAQEIEGARYVFSEEGAVQKGDFTFEGAAYYGDPKTGALLLGGIHATEGGNRYHNADGKAEQGWFDLADARYYQDEKLLLVTGRQVLKDEKGEDGLYYFAADGKLKTGNGWADGYYLLDGKVLTGPQTIEEKHYVFNDDGLVQKNHFQYRNAWYCADENGVLVLNAIRTLENGKQRYFGVDGAAVMGFFDIGEDSYYQNSEAYIVTGRQIIDGKTYFFANDGKQQKGDGWFDGYYLEQGVPVTGKRDIDGKTYIFGEDGIALKGEFTYGGATYWGDEAGALYKDAVRTRADGTKVYLDADGTTPTGWVESPTIGKYYQTQTGGKHVLATGFVEIGADTYYFSLSGKLFAGNPSGWYVIDGKQHYLLTDGRYCAPPRIKEVKTAHDADKKLYSITIDSVISGAAGTNSAGSFSFDGGKTWQASNVLTVKDSEGITIGAGKIRVRDGINEMVMHNQTVYLAPIVVIPGGSGNSGPGSYGIDVSMYNGSIDWPAVKASGINFAIIRATSANNAGYYVDPYFEANVRNAKAAGIDVGLYIYSYARSYQDVADEVNFFVNSQQAKNLRASGITLDYPVYVDYEDKKNIVGISYDQTTDFVRQMMVQLKNAGYYPGFYTFHSYINNFNVRQLVNEGYDFWYARYPAAPNPPSNPSNNPGVGTNVSIWQYCSDGNTNSAMKPYVNGVRTRLDLNYVYHDVPTRVHKFYGTGSSTTLPNAPDGVVTPDVLTVYDTNSRQVVTDNAASILARIVQTEVGGFNNAEVYKAQAIAAHSYIMFQAQSGGTPTVALSSPSGAVQAAVNEVADKIVTYNGTVANAMYSAANSGKTYSTEGMWGGHYPYLIAGVDSPGDLSATQYTNGGISWQNRTNTIRTETMKSNIEKMVPGSTNGRSDYENWITNPEYDGNGYLTYITVMGSRVKAGKFYDNCWGLYSPNFSMQYNGNGTWNFVTRGNGHCVGMSQWGAYGFAKQGWNYTQILGHYYPGTQIANLR